MEEKWICIKNKGTEEHISIRLQDSLMYDKLNILAAEYSVSVELLVNIAIRRLVNDIEFVRSLRNGKIE